MFINDSIYFEEIIIANLYATNREKMTMIYLINYLVIAEPYNIRIKTELHVLSEAIKRRITKFYSVCDYCNCCNNRNDCKIKWFKSESGIKDMNYCCSFC